MSQNPGSSRPHVVVVGGGLAGLTAAHRLLHARGGVHDPGPAVTVLDASHRLGGKIHTERLGGFLVEGGADSFLARKPWASRLAAELNIDRDIIGCEPGRPRAFVRRGPYLRPLPDGLSGLVPTRFAPVWTSRILSLAGCLRVALEPFVPANREEKDETVADFLRRRFGAEAFERLMQPLLGGLYGGEPEELSATSTLPNLIRAEREAGSVIRGLRAESRARARAGEQSPGRAPFLSFSGGMGQLVDALKNSIAAAEIALGSRVTGVRRSGARWRVERDNGPTLEADAVIITTPAPVAAGLLGDLDSEMAAALKGIPHSSTVVVNAAFSKTSLSRAPAGHGYLNPRGEGRVLSGVTWSSSKFSGRAPPDHILVRGFLRAGRLPGSGAESDESCLETLLTELQEVLGVHEPPVLWRVHRWMDSVPAYALGHRSRLDTLTLRLAHLSGLFLAGCSYQGVGIPDTVRVSQEAAVRALEQVGAGSAGLD